MRVASVLVVLVSTGLLAAGAATAAAPTRQPGVLVVALSLPAPGFQVGAVRRGVVVYARGFEVELARALARRLGLRRVRFVHVADARRLLAPGAKRWDVALAQVLPTPKRGRAVDLSEPYLRSDQAVLLARGVPRPRSLADLRRLQLCVVRGSRGADVAAGRVRPGRRAIVAADDATLLRLVQTGRCEAALREAPRLGRELSRSHRGAYGAVAGRIETEAAFAVALQRNSPLTARVDQALRRMRAEGKLGRLAKAWLGLDPARLRVLR
jgi:ABC-type amino acid transport substrate-binding protein